MSWAGEIWSGGQTGVDRAALDVACELGLPAGGWVPRGRLAEDGPIPARYDGLSEAPSADYSLRTTLNVRDTDATLLLFRNALTGGSAFTQEEARRLGKPCLALDLAILSHEEALATAHAWLQTVSPRRLNVAGPRASTDPDIAALAAVLLRDLLARQ